MAEIKTKKSKMTLEKLAAMTQRGFLQLDNKIDKVALRLDNKIDKVALILDNKIDKVALILDNKIDKVALDIKEMKENSSELFTRLDKFIKLYDDQKQELLMFGAQLRRLEERISRLENSTA